jgi:hypothetical protein
MIYKFGFFLMYIFFPSLIDADYLYMFAGLNAQQEVDRAVFRFNLKRDLFEKIYGNGTIPISREGCKIKEMIIF